MSKHTFRAIETLVVYVLDSQIIPRTKALDIDCPYREKSMAYYQALREDKNPYSLSVRQIAKKTLRAVLNNFRGVHPDTLMDMISDVITSTIQSERNEYNKVKKSTFGFWKQTFNLNPDESRFDVCFPHIFFKAIQTLLKSVKIRNGHEVIDPRSEDNDEWTYISTVKDERNEKEKEEYMTGYEQKIKEIYSAVLGREDLDELSLNIFSRWFSLKEERLEFDRPVKMSSEVYPVIQKEYFEQTGKNISQVSLHVRWKKVLSIIRSVLE